jgi:hypothetical protein
MATGGYPRLCRRSLQLGSKMTDGVDLAFSFLERFVEGKLKSDPVFTSWCGKISQKGELDPPGLVRFSSILIETRLVRRTGAKDSGELM